LYAIRFILSNYIGDIDLSRSVAAQGIRLDRARVYLASRAVARQDQILS